MEYGLVALWLATYLSIGALSLPLAGAAFSTVRGRGVAFAIPIGLVTIAAVGYIVGHLAFGLPALLAGLAVLAAASVRFGDFERRLWRHAVEISVVFAVAFLFAVSLRAVSPAIAPLPIAAGEKFLDYGLLRSLLRSPALPPEDMWFAGKAVQYYQKAGEAYFLADKPKRATRMFEQAADRLLLHGDVWAAARNYLSGALVAEEAGNHIQAVELGWKVHYLTNSDRLTVREKRLLRSSIQVM